MPPTLTEQCTVQIRKAILSGQLKTDDGLVTEKALCEQLNVSRVTIRRCLARLREEKLLISIPYKGYVLGSAAIARRNERRQAIGATGNRVLYVRSPSASMRGYHEQRIWQAASQQAARFGLEIEVCCQPLGGILKQIDSSAEQLRGIAMEWSEREVVQKILAQGIPAVAVEYAYVGMPLDAVYQDDKGGIEQAVDRLWRQGHRRIGLIEWDSSAHQPLARRSAFLAAHIRRGLVQPASIGMSVRFDPEGGRQATRMLFRRSDPPDAIIIGHLEMAAGVFDALAEQGLRPGKDISVIAWGTPEAQAVHLAGTRWNDLPLDLIEWSREEMGRAAIRILETRARDPMVPRLHVEIPVRLVLHGST